MNSAERIAQFVVDNLPRDIDRRRQILADLVELIPDDPAPLEMLGHLERHLRTQQAFCLGEVERGSGRLSDRPIARGTARLSDRPVARSRGQGGGR